MFGHQTRFDRAFPHKLKVRACELFTSSGVLIRSVILNSNECPRIKYRIECDKVVFNSE